MLLFDRGDRLPLRTPLVLAFLNAGLENFNGFIVSANRKELLSRMEMTATNTKSAMQELSQITGVDGKLPAVEQISGFTDSFFQRAEGASKKNPEEIIAKDFDTAATIAFGAIIALQKEEDQRLPFDRDKIETAMSGMRDIHIIASNMANVYRVMEERGIQPVLFCN